MAKAKQVKVQIAERALVARINRHLRREANDEGVAGLALKKVRTDSPQWRDLGDYYLIDYTINAIADKKVDIEAYAREIGVMQEWEALAGE